MITRLPRHSHYKAALENDEEFAEIALTLNLPERPARIPLVGYDETVARLDNVFDAVNLVRETLESIYSKRGHKPRENRAVRPENAQQRIKRQQARSKLQSIEDRMTGGR